MGFFHRGQKYNGSSFDLDIASLVGVGVLLGHFKAMIIILSSRCRAFVKNSVK